MPNKLLNHKETIRLYEMNTNQLTAEMQKAEAAGDTRWAEACSDQIELLARIGASFSAPREHALAADCWCNPTLEQEDPETGVRLFTHHKPS